MVIYELDGPESLVKMCGKHCLLMEVKNTTLTITCIVNRLNGIGVYSCYDLYKIVKKDGADRIKKIRGIGDFRYNIIMQMFRECRELLRGPRKDKYEHVEIHNKL